MTPRFPVRPSPRFARLARHLTDQHPQEFPARYAEAIAILKIDPTNRTGRYRVKKLKGVYCGLRREDTYRGR